MFVKQRLGDRGIKLGVDFASTLPQSASTIAPVVAEIACDQNQRILGKKRSLAVLSCRIR